MALAAAFEPELHGANQAVAETAAVLSDPWTTSDEDWDLHRAIIEDLYVRQNKSLKTVMAIMSKEHGLRGTYVLRPSWPLPHASY
jgi:hypothetical protein